MSDFRANLWKLYLYEVLVFTPFFLPVAVLFWQDNGLDLYDVFILQGAYAVAAVVLEVPTGMVADRMGRRASLLAAACFLAFGMSIYASGTTFWAFLAAELTLALGQTMFSGADYALLYDTLEADGREEEFTYHVGRLRAVQMMSVAVSSIVGGFVGAWSLRATVVASVVGPTICIAIALSLTDARVPVPADTFREGVAAYRKLITDTVRFISRHRLVLWYVAFLGVLNGSSAWLLWLYQPYMEHTGLPLWAFGVAFAVFNLSAAAASAVSHRFEEVFGEQGSIGAFMALEALPPLLMAMFITPWSLVFILGHQMVRGAARPVIAARILRYTYDDKRATVLSVGAMGSRFFFALTAPAIGWVAEERGLIEGIGIQGFVLIGVFALLIAWYNRLDRKYFEVKPVGSDH